MKKSTPNPYALSPELLAATDALEEARAKCRKLVEQVDLTADLVVEGDLDVARLQGELAAAEGALALCDAPDAQRLEQDVERLTEELAAKERAVRRGRAKIDALEQMAPDLDAVVDARFGDVSAAKLAWFTQVKAAISKDLQDVVPPLKAVLNKVHGLHRSVLRAELDDFLAAAWLPDPLDFKRVPTSSMGMVNQGINILTVADGEVAAPVEDIAPAVRSVLQSQRFYHPRYEPVAKRRPKSMPYVLKGRTETVSRPV